MNGGKLTFCLIHAIVNHMFNKDAWKDALGLGALIVLISVVFVAAGVAEQARLESLNGQ